ASSFRSEGHERPDLATRLAHPNAGAGADAAVRPGLPARLVHRGDLVGPQAPVRAARVRGNLATVRTGDARLRRLARPGRRGVLAARRGQVGAHRAGVPTVAAAGW